MATIHTTEVSDLTEFVNGNVDSPGWHNPSQGLRSLNEEWVSRLPLAVILAIADTDGGD